MSRLSPIMVRVDKPGIGVNSDRFGPVCGMPPAAEEEITRSHPLGSRFYTSGLRRRSFPAVLSKKPGGLYFSAAAIPSCIREHAHAAEPGQKSDRKG